MPRLFTLTLLSCLPVCSQLYAGWAGALRDNTQNGYIAPTLPLKIVVESYPQGEASAARVIYTLNNGASWQSVNMNHFGKVDGHDWWDIDLGSFNQGTVVRYAVEVQFPGESLWVNNGGSDYFAEVDAAKCPVRWVGNTWTHPAPGVIDPGSDLWINTETSSAGVASSVNVRYSTDGGVTWTTAPMDRSGFSNGNDAWHVNIGRFPEGTTVRYYVVASSAAGDLSWDSNGGADYEVQVNSLLRDVYPDKSRCNPGDTAAIQVELYNATNDAENAVVRVSVKSLTAEVAAFQQNVALNGWTGQVLSFPWQTPFDDFCGYGIDVTLTVNGQVRATRSSALDVSSDWTKFPRYGFYSEYYAGDDYNRKAAELSKFHINAIQFYDWMWTHDRLVPYWNGAPADTFTQVDGRVQSLNTIRNKVTAARARNIFTMAYSLIYGDSGNNDPEYPEWCAFRSPWSTSEDRIDYHDAGYRIFKMDVTNPGWQNHLFNQFRDSIDKVGFDGIHLDNLGGTWNYRYNSDTGIDESRGFPDFINRARANLRMLYPKACITHNDVATNYLDNVARSDADLYYSEVWIHHTYNEIRQLISRGQSASGKQVVLAAYINRKSWSEMGDPTKPPQPTWINDASAKLMDACIFANGGFHLEMGENGDMLVNEYFPLRSPRIHAGLKRSMRSFYDFAVRYENFLFHNTLGGVRDSTDAMQIWSGTHALSKDAQSGTIWTILKEWKDEYDTLSLINLNGVDPQWRNVSSNPAPQSGVLLKYYMDKKAQRVLLATPDDGLGQAVELPFMEGVDGPGYYVTFTVPSLRFWDLIIVDKTSRIKTDGWPGDWSGTAPAALHSTTISNSEWVYRGEGGDARMFAGASPDSDITEARVTSDANYVYFLFRMQQIADAKIPALGLALDTDQNTSPNAGFRWIGDSSLPTGSMPLVYPVQNAEKEIMFFSDQSGLPCIRIYDGNGWKTPPSADSAIVISEQFDTIEARINRRDVGLNYPQRVSLSAVSFRSSRNAAGSDCTYDCPDGNNDAIDSVGGDYGVSANTWVRELSDNNVGRYHQFVLDSTGAKAIPPIITSTLATTAVERQMFNYQIVASNSPIFYGASNLPTGLSINNTNGLISGIPSVSGTFLIPLQATNSGGSANVTLTLTVQPAIPAVPTNVAAVAGEAEVRLSWNPSARAATYRVKRATTSGGPYASVGGELTSSVFVNSGLKNGTKYYYVVSAVNISGESANSAEVSAVPMTAYQKWKAKYSITSDEADDDGDGMNALLEYALAGNPSISSASESVRILPGLKVASDGALSITFIRQRPELTYRVEASSDLRKWATIATNPGTPGTSVTVADSNLSSSTRYLRLAVSNGSVATKSLPQGRVRLALTTGKENAVSLPLLDRMPAIAGRSGGFVNAVGSNYLDCSGAGWTAGALSRPAAPFLLRITSGTATGRLFPVSTLTPNTSTRLYLVATGLGLLGIRPGKDTFELAPADTLKTLFPSGVLRSGTLATADLFETWTGRNWTKYYHNGTRWVREDGVAADNLMLRPDQGYLIKRRGGTMPLTLTGTVPSTRSLVTVPAGSWSFVGFSPVGETFSQLGIQNLKGWSSNALNPTQGDHVRLWSGSAWSVFYYLNAHWYSSTGTIVDGSILNRAGRPFMIVRPGGFSDLLIQARPY